MADNDDDGNPWKLTTIWIVLVMATALVTGLVVANWSESTSRTAIWSLGSGSSWTRPAAPVTTATTSATTPSQKVVEACNRQAAEQAQRATAMGVSNDAAEIGRGPLYGLDVRKKNDERYRSAYAACLRARGYSG